MEDDRRATGGVRVERSSGDVRFSVPFSESGEQVNRCVEDAADHNETDEDLR